MDQPDFDYRLAELSGMWAVARNKRKRRAKEQAQTALRAKTARRNARKATALVALAEALLVTATLTVGLTMFHLTASQPYPAVVLAISVAFGAHEFLSRLFTATFGPAINRLRGLKPKGADQ